MVAQWAKKRSRVILSLNDRDVAQHPGFAMTRDGAAEFKAPRLDRHEVPLGLIVGLELDLTDRSLDLRLGRFDLASPHRRGEPQSGEVMLCVARIPARDLNLRPNHCAIP